MLIALSICIHDLEEEVFKGLVVTEGCETIGREVAVYMW